MIAPLETPIALSKKAIALREEAIAGVKTDQHKRAEMRCSLPQAKS
jgi:hypothetical protein